MSNFGIFDPDLWSTLRKFQDEVERVVSGPREKGLNYPTANIWTSADQVIVALPLPGADSEQLDVSIEAEGKLIVKGATAEPELPEGYARIRKEWSAGRFARTVDLPCSVDLNQVDARFRRGILEIRLQRADSTKARRINVQEE